MVRHVWAHRAGIADAKFIRQAAHLGYGQGDLVATTNEQLQAYLSAVLLYAMIIIKRHRAVFGLDPMSIDKVENDSSGLADAFRSLYPPNQDAEPAGTSK
jgi:hypothetical protein